MLFPEKLIEYFTHLTHLNCIQESEVVFRVKELCKRNDNLSPCINDETLSQHVLALFLINNQSGFFLQEVNPDHLLAETEWQASEMHVLAMMKPIKKGI